MLALLGMAVTASVVIAVSSTTGMRRMSEMQDAGHARAADAMLARQAADRGAKLYQVVADSVINLVVNVIREIADQTSLLALNAAIEAARAEQGRERVEVGVTLATNAGGAIVEVQDSAGRVVQAVSDISSGLQEQRAASTQIAQSVERIAQMAEESNAATGQIVDATANLEEFARALKQMTERFRLASAGIGA